MGDLEGAIDVLRRFIGEGRAVTNAHFSLLFQLLTLRAPTANEALEVAGAGLAQAQVPITKSTWALRRGLIHLEQGRRADALADLLLVLKLRASEDQQSQARKALLRVAALAP